MSTNYYLRHIPTEDQIKSLKDLIDSSRTGENFKDILYMVSKLYSEPEEWATDGLDDWGVLHIGKRTPGWKFSWCPNIIKKNCSYADKDNNWVSKYEYIYRYPLTKQGLQDFIMRDDIVVVNEYDEIQDKKEFFEMAFSWEEKDGWDSLTYTKGEKTTWNFQEAQSKYKALGFNFTCAYQSDFYNDGLRWCIWEDFR